MEILLFIVGLVLGVVGSYLDIKSTIEFSKIDVKERNPIFKTPEGAPKIGKNIIITVAVLAGSVVIFHLLGGYYWSGLFMGVLGVIRMVFAKQNYKRIAYEKEQAAKFGDNPTAL